MGPMKVENELKGAFGAQNDGNEALKIFATQIVQSAWGLRDP